MQVFDELLEKWISGDLDEQQVKILLAHLDQFNTPWPAYIDRLLNDAGISGLGNEAQKERIYNQLIALRLEKNKVVRRPVIRMNVARWTAAAAVVIIAVTGFWWYRTQKVKNLNMMISSSLQDSALSPGSNRAVLTLGDGAKIILDSSHDGKLTAQSGAVIYKSNGGIITYHPTNAIQGQGNPVAPTYNTLSTPKGGEYRLVLPDGTKVWLNAASSIYYPTSFTDEERNVSITGEAYFEVAKDASRPFHVKVNNMVVTVIGTHFNINAYSDESTVNTTLLEGLVRIDNGNSHHLILPGQEAKLDKNEVTKIITGVDTLEVISWKNGYFYFNHADLPTVMRQISRWYDVTVEYKGPIPDMRFSGEIPRSANATEILKILERSELHFEVEGKKIIVQ